MEEIWKDIEGYEGLYQVSNTGKVRSLIQKSELQAPWHLLKPCLTRGYASVGLWRKQNGAKTFLVHRLVAKAFVPNPNGYKEVNHKDEDKLNNCSDNLEWCTREYNMSYRNARVRQGISCSTPVQQFTVDGIYIATYVSIPIAAKINNLDESSIHKCCNMKRKYVGGYSWKYKE